MKSGSLKWNNPIIQLSSTFKWFNLPALPHSAKNTYTACHKDKGKEMAVCVSHWICLLVVHK